jgi:hypothetical protein
MLHISDQKEFELGALPQGAASAPPDQLGGGRTMGIWNRRMAAHGLLVCLLVVGSTYPCFGETKRGWKKVWAVSVAALATAHVMDARSSMGRYEANPLLQNGQGQFSPGRGFAVKAAASGGMILVQMLLQRRRPEQRLEKQAAIVNFAAAAVVGATAYRNSKIH